MAHGLELRSVREPTRALRGMALLHAFLQGHELRGMALLHAFLHGHELRRPRLCCSVDAEHAAEGSEDDEHEDALDAPVWGLQRWGSEWAEAGARAVCSSTLDCVIACLVFRLI